MISCNRLFRFFSYMTRVRVSLKLTTVARGRRSPPAPRLLSADASLPVRRWLSCEEPTLRPPRVLTLLRHEGWPSVAGSQTRTLRAVLARLLLGSAVPLVVLVIAAAWASDMLCDLG